MATWLLGELWDVSGAVLGEVGLGRAVLEEEEEADLAVDNEVDDVGPGTVYLFSTKKLAFDKR